MTLKNCEYLIVGWCGQPKGGREGSWKREEQRRGGAKQKGQLS